MHRKSAPARPRPARATWLFLLSLGLAQAANAGVYLNTIHDAALLAPNGHNGYVSGPIGCDAGETVSIRVTLTQPSTGAMARGRTQIRCSGRTQHWLIHAATRSPVALEPGPVDAHASARTWDAGTITETRSWRKAIELVPMPGVPGPPDGSNR